MTNTDWDALAQQQGAAAPPVASPRAPGVPQVDLGELAPDSGRARPRVDWSPAGGRRWPGRGSRPGYGRLGRGASLGVVGPLLFVALTVLRVLLELWEPF